MAALADVPDVEALLGRSLTPSETPAAEARLRRASRIIRGRWSDVDARIAAGTLLAEDVADVVAEMVKRTIQRPIEGVEQVQQTAGPFGQSVRYTNPDGNLYLTAEEIRLFGPEPKTRRGRAFAVDLATP